MFYLNFVDFPMLLLVMSIMNDFGHLPDRGTQAFWTLPLIEKSSFFRYQNSAGW